jgi:hypothetical protein
LVSVLLLWLGACVQTAAPDWRKHTLSGTVVGTLDPVQDACVLGAWLWVSGELRDRWEGETTLGFGRSQYRNGAWTLQDTNFLGHRVTVQRHGADTIHLSLSGPITATLVGVWKGEAFEGDWSCDHRFPFAGDSAVGGRGGWVLLPQ